MMILPYPINTKYIKYSIYILLGTGRGDTNFDTSITIFSKFTSEEFVKFSVEDTVSDLIYVFSSEIAYFD